MHREIHTYDELRHWISIFHHGALDLMIIEGSAGSGKSSTIRNSLRDTPTYEYCWLEGRLSAVYLYEQAYLHRDCPIFLDDVDGMYADKNSVQMLKQLCQTETEKLVMWNTKTMVLEENVPRQFYTKSKVLLITNAWRTLNKHVGAVEDRGIVLSFYPSAQEVHARAADLDLGDTDVYAFLEAHMTRIKHPSLRHYRNAKKLKDAGLTEWKEVLIESFGVGELEEIVLKLLEEDIKPGARAKRFAEISGRSSRMFWRIKKTLQNA